MGQPQILMVLLLEKLDQRIAELGWGECKDQPFATCFSDAQLGVVGDNPETPSQQS